MTGKKVFSNASAHRMDNDVPLLLPLVNGSSIRLVMSQESYKKTEGRGFIITNSNCAAVGLCTALKALITKLGPIAHVSCSTLQAISGGGYPGIPSLDIIGNVIPYIENEEVKIEAETKKILGTVNQNMNTVDDYNMKVTALVHRVPVRVGHIVSMSVQFQDEVAKEDIVKKASEALTNYIPEDADQLLNECPSAPKNPIHVRPEADRPQPVLDSMEGGGFTTVCGVVRPCPVFDIKFSTLAHNTIIGAAGGSILNAEYAL